jgi:hypothetical protein
MFDLTRTITTNVCSRNIAHTLWKDEASPSSIFETHSLPDETPGRGWGSHFFDFKQQGRSRQSYR